MRRRSILGGLLVPILATVVHGEEIDLVRVDLAVKVAPERLEVAADLKVAAGDLPERWALELADAMAPESVRCDGRDVPFTRDGWSLVLDLSGLRAAGGGERTFSFRVAGRPRVRFSPERGGFVRTDVGAERTYIRSQYAWYPRPPDDLAAYRTVVEAPEGWTVRTTGRRVGAGTPAVFERERPVRRIGLVAGPYVVVEEAPGDGLAIEALAFPEHEAGARAVLETARRAFALYRTMLGPIRLERFSLVEMPPAFGETSGYGEADAILLGTGAFAGGRALDGLIAHEAAHLWWGQEVSFRHFFSESLASYAALRWLEATKGADAARDERRKAVEAVVEAAGEGKAIPLGDIRDWGANLDPRTYRVHAYEKGMMLLVMAEAAMGRERMDAALAALVAGHRDEILDWPAVRDALGKAGGASVRSVLEQGERAEVPRLEVSRESRRAGRTWRTSGTVAQAGTARPWRLGVVVRAVGAGDPVDETVSLAGRQARFSLTTSEEPQGIVLDPDWLLLAGRPGAGPVDPEKVVDEAFAVVSNPKDGDRARCEKAIALLRGLLAAGAGDREGLCHTGIGRCLFRLGKLDEAEAALRKALETGAGGPFHRAWASLRLGNIADLRGDRAKAEALYGQVLAGGRGGYTAQLAQRFLERPYRGYERDG